jgi:hypothetical protein
MVYNVVKGSKEDNELYKYYASIQYLERYYEKIRKAKEKVYSSDVIIYSLAQLVLLNIHLSGIISKNITY